jgi:formylglycine-generating enzyme required for sulfatase activity
MLVRSACIAATVALFSMLAAPKPAKRPAAPKPTLTMGSWYVAGPFTPTEGRGFAVEFGPERSVSCAEPVAGVSWVKRDMSDGQSHDLGLPDNGSAYLMRTITSPAARTVMARFGSDDGLAVWLNGVRLLANDVPRVTAPDQDSLALPLRTGENRLLAKVYNISGGSGFFFRLDGDASAGDVIDPVSAVAGFPVPALRRAVRDLMAQHGAGYPKGATYLARIDSLCAAITKGPEGGRDAAVAELAALRREALLANPLLRFDKLLLVRRSEKLMGLPQNWQGNSSIPARGYDNRIERLSIATGARSVVYQPQGGAFVGDLEPHWDARRLLLSMPGTHDRFQLFEMPTEGGEPRQVTPGEEPDVDNYSGAYLPDGRIVYCSTACYIGVPCVGGGDSVGSLYLLDPKSGSARQLTYDQDHSWYPRVLNNGQVLYTRWEYSDTPHYFSRLLFKMNPDGSNQMEEYGSNSFWPNSLFYARPVPGHPSKLTAIVSGHHGVPRMGELMVLDPARGRHEASGVVQRVPGFGKRVDPIIRDQLVETTSPRFLHPFPLSEKYFLVSCQPAGRPWGIYLADVFDNLVCLAEEPGYALLEPVPVMARPMPPATPDRAKVAQKSATIFLADVYRGPGLKGVPRGTVKSLRVYANHYGYRGMGGHVNVGIDGPWDVKRILGTVPVNSRGSALFTAPANLPLVVQPLDAEGKALQVMRSWYTAMPGEFATCQGCHEPQSSAPGLRRPRPEGMVPAKIAPWFGPARGFGFEREVQAPVLQRYCVSCHSGTPGRPDLRARAAVANYRGAFTPAYEALHRFVRRPGNESDYHLQRPREWDAGTSELVQMLKKGHHGVKLAPEAWDRLYTWIDLNVPCHGTWTAQNGAAPERNRRMMELAQKYGGSDIDHEAMPPDLPPSAEVSPMPEAPAQPAQANPAGWPFGPDVAARKRASHRASRVVDLGNGVKLRLTYVPPGAFVMGSNNGALDERPMAARRVDKGFWMAVTETTNAQYARFDPRHDNGVIGMRNKDHTSRGYPMDRPNQPAVRVTWAEADRFARWLSRKTGLKFDLPTETQWEYACRAGSAGPFWFGGLDTDFGRAANMADQSLTALAVAGIDPKPVANPDPLLDWSPKETRFSDGALLPTDAGSFAPNPWGLHDMHGNVAEWTRSVYTRRPGGGDAATDPAAERVVRGGSWYDRPARCTASYRLSYAPWQTVYNVGFRVICRE